MQYDDLFDRTTLGMMSEAQRDARTRNKPAITIFMAAKVFIDRANEMSRRVFGEMDMDIDAFERMANLRIEEMPSVSEATPYVDDELDDIVRSSIQRDGEGHIIAGSVSAETLLRSILQIHGDEYRLFLQEEEGSGHPSEGRSGSILERYADDWTARASRGELEPVIGRDAELAEIEEVMIQKSKNNAVLTGDPGTGKTAIGESLAVKIAEGDVPEELRGAKMLSLNFAAILEREGQGGVKEALDAVSQSGKAILFIDEIHALHPLVKEALKTPMARGGIWLLGTTTNEEYSQFIESNKALSRRIRRINIKELSESDSLAVLEHIRPGYERHHGIHISDEALQAAVSLSQRYITTRHQPDKSIDLIDAAAAKVRMAGHHGPVTEDDVREVLARRTGIPVEKLSTDEKTRLMNMEQELGSEVIGQPQAIAAITKAIRRNSVGLSDPHRPLGSFLFNGHSGMGKTKLCQALAKFLFGREDAMKRLDMTEYQEAHSVSRLIGSPPGYVGHNEGGQLTEYVSLHPYSVVLFDEIEKAHPNVFKTLLQVLDHGRLTDGRGREVDFTNTIVIMTSNLVDDSSFSGRQRIGFGACGTGEPNFQDDGAAIRRHFSKEFLNRLDDVIRFNDLDADALLNIARKMLTELKQELAAKGFNVAFDESVAEYIVNLDAGFGQGARPIRRAIEQHIDDVLTSRILAGELPQDKQVLVSVSGGTVQFTQ